VIAEVRDELAKKAKKKKKEEKKKKKKKKTGEEAAGGYESGETVQEDKVQNGKQSKKQVDAGAGDSTTAGTEVIKEGEEDDKEEEEDQGEGADSERVDDSQPTPNPAAPRASTRANHPRVPKAAGATVALGVAAGEANLQALSNKASKGRRYSSATAD
jgi:hypothetical protein